MTADQLPPYEELPSRIDELTARLRRHDDGDVVEGVLTLHRWNEEFNRVGVIRLTKAILAWRGEIFLDSVLEDDVIRVFLSRYGVHDAE